MIRCLVCSLVLLSVAITPSVTRADVHTIFINEYYTQCDNGANDAQYIELKALSIGNFFRQCASIQVKRTLAGPDVFFAKPVFAGHADSQVFPNGNTYLIATPAFQTATGITPDLLIPNGTLDPAGGVIRFAADSGCVLNHGTIHLVAYGDQGVSPAPGPHQAANLSARNLTFSLGGRSPQTFAGATTSNWTCGAVPVELSTWGRVKALYR